MARADDTRHTALVVEDDPGQSELGAMMLAEFDLDVSQVRSAEAAIDHLRSRSGEVTVLLADVRLAGELDGIQLVNRVSILWPAISLIVTSGSPLQEGADLPERCVYIPKPWRALDIVAAVERAASADHSVHAVRL